MTSGKMAEEKKANDPQNQNDLYLKEKSSDKAYNNPEKRLNFATQYEE